MEINDRSNDGQLLLRLGIKKWVREPDTEAWEKVPESQ